MSERAGLAHALALPRGCPHSIADPLDPGKTYDGWDMSALLFPKQGRRVCNPDPDADPDVDRAGCAAAAAATAGEAGARRDRYFYHTSEDSVGALVAVRLGPWKLHFVTKGSHCDSTFPDAACYAASTDRRAGGGLLFNVERDMSEVLPLDTSSFEYKLWAPVLWQMAYNYTESIFTEAERPPSEMGRGGSPLRFPCCSQCSPMPNCCACNRTSPTWPAVSPPDQ